jgi:hypothetical protein
VNKMDYKPRRRRMSRPRIAGCGIAMLIIWELFARHSVNLEGRVLDGSGLPLRNVQIRARVGTPPPQTFILGADAHPNVGTNTTVEAQTDDGGYFVIRAPRGDAVLLDGVGKPGMEVRLDGRGYGGLPLYKGEQIRGHSLLVRLLGLSSPPAVVHMDLVPGASADGSR